MKIEMHTHTSEASPCANVCAKDIPALYQKAGYDAIVITDHYCKWAQERSGMKTAEEYAEYFLKGYQAARAAGNTIGFTVLPGAEVNLPGSPNDYLLYGITEDFIRKYPAMHELTLEKLYLICHQHDILLFQAHPYRTYCTPADPSYLDGAESFNGNPRHNNQNVAASQWVEKNKLIPSSGSDFHEFEDVAKGGIETPVSVTTPRMLYQVLQSGSYRLLTP